MIDFTHDLKAQSWVISANNHPNFPLQNLPLGIFSTASKSKRGGVAIGDYIFDIKENLYLFKNKALKGAKNASKSTLNAYFALSSDVKIAFRHRLFEILSLGKPEIKLVNQSEATMRLPAKIGDYTDFYAGIHHAHSVGKMFRPDMPLLPNYRFVPIGYHGRASSIVISGTPVRRPFGQTKSLSEDNPTYHLTNRLDFELEMGIWIGKGNKQGEPIDIKDAHNHIAGFCLLNDWSARDIQAWEYQPLGPFLSKSFATTISAWVITPEALVPFRIAQSPRAINEPAPLPYLWNKEDQAQGGLKLSLEISILTQKMRDKCEQPHVISKSDTAHLYWTFAQLITHHSSNGCNLNVGDIFGTGTISGNIPNSAGSMLELSLGGKKPIMLGGENRAFLEKGDEIILNAFTETQNFARIGFGECRGIITS